MKFSNKFIILMCNVFLFIKTLLAQDIVIKGKVRHANTYQEITKVNIYI